MSKAQFFQETFLLADININVILEMPFLILRNTNIQFIEEKLTWVFYITQEVLSTNKSIELIHKKEFIKVVLDKDVKFFMVYKASFVSKISIHLAQKAQIVVLITKKVTNVAEYKDFTNMFLKKLAKLLPKLISNNKQAIKLKNSKQQLYRLL